MKYLNVSYSVWEMHFEPALLKYHIFKGPHLPPKNVIVASLHTYSYKYFHISSTP